MLISHIWYGTSRCLARRPFPSSVSITRKNTLSNHSTLERERREEWAAVPKDVQYEAGESLAGEDQLVAAGGLKLDGPCDTSKNSNCIGATSGGPPSSGKLFKKRQLKFPSPENARPHDDEDDAVSTTRVSRLRDHSFSKLSEDNHVPKGSSIPIADGTTSNLHRREVRETDKSSSLRYRSGDDTKANSAFLDQLHKDEVRRAIAEAGPNMPISEKMSRLRETMAARNPQALLKYMVQTSDDLEFMNAIPGVTFIELLRQLHPEDDFSPLRSEYKGQGPKHYRMLSNWRSQFYKALLDRRRFYQDIAMKRIASGRELGLGEYTQLLNLARATWDGFMALEIMKSMVASDILPSLTCYNHYFEARCWSDAYHPDEMQRLRVMPYNLEMRKTSPKRQVASEVMVEGHKVEENGIRWEITRMFTKMVKEGINADTRAYCNLITAQSREGDLRAIKSVLHRVWHVDIDKLLAGQPDSDRNKLPEDSPTYPTNDLLFTLAHAFGSNSDIPAAIRIVDHFSRKYSITIPQLVWGELMQWTFVLSTRRRKARRLDGAAIGQLPLGSVESLWNVMQGPPYHSAPNLLMYDYLIRSFWRRDRRSLYAYLDHMRAGIKFHERDCAAHKAAQRELADAARLLSSSGEDGRELELGDAEKLESLRVRADAARSKRWLSFVLARKWFILLLCNQRWLKEPWVREVKWSRKMLPDIVREFLRYKAHRPISYPVLGGRVELEDPVAERQWAVNKAAREEKEERWGELGGSEKWGDDDDEDAGDDDDEALTEEEREILEEDEFEAEDEWADGRAEDIQQDLDDL